MKHSETSWGGPPGLQPASWPALPQRYLSLSLPLCLSLSLLSAAIQTGPEIGARIPDFSAADQNGKPQTFASLRGPHGLMLMFVRSADW